MRVVKGDSNGVLTLELWCSGFDCCLGLRVCPNGLRIIIQIPLGDRGGSVYQKDHIIRVGPVEVLGWHVEELYLVLTMSLSHLKLASANWVAAFLRRDSITKWP